MRLLKRMRQRNGLEWPRDRIPTSFIKELDQVEDRLSFETTARMGIAADDGYNQNWRFPLALSDGVNEQFSGFTYVPPTDLDE